MTFDRCPCCEITALPHTADCTFAADCPVECEQFDGVAELRAEVARLRLTDEERDAILRLSPSGDPLAARMVLLTPEDRRVFHGLLERLT